MNLHKILKVSFFIPNYKLYREMIDYDKKINLLFRYGNVNKKKLKGNEWKFINIYRKFQSNKDNLWGKFYLYKLNRIEEKTGIRFEGNPNIGKGLIIGHWGRIIINGHAQFGNEVFLTHNVTIGRDIRGKRKGVPTIGNRVCIRTNSTVVGNVQIGDDVLIAPNTFVNFDVPSHSVVIGNPASIHHKENATEGHIPKIQDCLSDNKFELEKSEIKGINTIERQYEKKESEGNSIENKLSNKVYYRNSNTLPNNSIEVPILYERKEECCGCYACYNICSHKAIEMIEDEEGFLYPFIVNELCVRCHQCIKVCPIKKIKANRS